MYFTLKHKCLPGNTQNLEQNKVQSARLLDITMNNGTLLGDRKKATVVPIHKGGDRSLVTNYRPVSLTSVVCQQMEHVIASYLRRVG